MSLLARLWAAYDRLEDGRVLPACSVALLFAGLYGVLSLGGEP